MLNICEKLCSPLESNLEIFLRKCSCPHFWVLHWFFPFSSHVIQVPGMSGKFSRCSWCLQAWGSTLEEHVWKNSLARGSPNYILETSTRNANKNLNLYNHRHGTGERAPESPLPREGDHCLTGCWHSTLSKRLFYQKHSGIAPQKINQQNFTRENQKPLPNLALKAHKSPFSTTRSQALNYTRSPGIV